MTNASASAHGDGFGGAGSARWAGIAASLRARIVAGEWSPGQALPSEVQLAREHSVALGTLRAAIQALVDDCLVDRVHGKGTFVRGSLSGGALSRFFRWGRADAALPRSEVRATKVLGARRDCAAALGIAPGSAVLRLLRHRLRDDCELLHETIHLPLPAFQALVAEPRERLGPLLYPVYADRCGVTVHRALDDLSFASLAGPVARALGVPPGHPGVRVERRAFDLAGRPVEFRITFGNAEHFHYQAEVR